MSTAEVRNVQMTDEGDYQCRATNKYGDSVFKTIAIQVLGECSSKIIMKRRWEVYH